MISPEEERKAEKRIAAEGQRGGNPEIDPEEAKNTSEISKKEVPVRVREEKNQ